MPDHRTDHDWERLVRDSLATAGEQAPREVRAVTGPSRGGRVGIAVLAAFAAACVVVVAVALLPGSDPAGSLPSDRPATSSTVGPAVGATRTVAYRGLQVEVPSWYGLNAADRCGPTADTVLLPPQGAVGFDNCGKPAATAVWFFSSVWRAELRAPRSITVRSGLSGRLRTGPTSVGGWRIELSLDGELVTVDSPDTTAARAEARRIVRSVAPVPQGTTGTRPVGYDSIVVDMPIAWRINAVGCGTPQADTVIPGEWGVVPACGAPRPAGITDVVIESAADVRDWELAELDHEEVLPSGIAVQWGERAAGAGFDSTERLRGLTVVAPDFDIVVTARAADLTEAWAVIRTLRPVDAAVAAAGDTG